MWLFFQCVFEALAKLTPKGRVQTPPPVVAPPPPAKIDPNADIREDEREYLLGFRIKNSPEEFVHKRASQRITRWKEAAQNGLSAAQNLYGACLVWGIGINQNFTEAVAWYRKAAAQGTAIAQSNLGVAYATGQGVAKDDAEAVAWYRKAAEQGDNDAVAALKRLGPKA
ncbi:MAG: sel1 repeat family protein [Gemmataceae bacterium]|nr:sel1 repeat family protein [Gemmataceae bacterium]